MDPSIGKLTSTRPYVFVTRNLYKSILKYLCCSKPSALFAARLLRTVFVRGEGVRGEWRQNNVYGQFGLHFDMVILSVDWKIIKYET